jgi:hypothetical protein
MLTTWGCPRVSESLEVPWQHGGIPDMWTWARSRCICRSHLQVWRQFSGFTRRHVAPRFRVQGVAHETFRNRFSGYAQLVARTSARGEIDARDNGERGWERERRVDVMLAN